MEDYIWEVSQPAEDAIRRLMDATGLSRACAIVLGHRGIAPEDAGAFLRPELRGLSDPYLLPGTRDAAQRLWEAVKRNERILIHGDYDTDGITASALLAGVLRDSGAEVECFIPHRIDDGYGLTPESVEKASQDGFSLLVTVDCGITGYDALRAAQECELDVVVTDHHVPGDEPVPAVAVVNPKLPGAPPSTLDLAGVGVAFKVCHAFLKLGREQGWGGHETDLRSSLDLVAIGTVADIVPLLSENRALVKHGLEVLSRQHRPGIHALCGVAKVGDIVQASDITYRLAPRLNAAGRLGDPTVSLRLLESGNVVSAAGLARELDSQNRKRQQMEEAAVNLAEAQIAEKYDLETDRSLVVWSDDWHQGVVGIVASRLARRYHRPSVVLTRDANGLLTGSGRSVRRLNLVSLMERCRESLIRFGGHAMAAGLSLELEHLDEFRVSFEASVKQVLGPESMRSELDICGHVPFAEIDDTFFEEMTSLEPFGHGNPEPVFVTHGVWPDRCIPVAGKHTRGTVCDDSGARMSFIAFGLTRDDLPPPPWDLVYTPQLNRYAGRCTPQARVVDVRSAS
ncbi:MAG: single-stranded-DNA-specific exonuclease RecJ [Lentisphaerae bacterium]|jgi:single-stranded-DNA-specific exonuclease|nr:single-stranded-DNA-specific exonuclease RecJ [Lentisphaerota bacterium]MBT4819021.1 single-stranded-DNA-specific exonuclease RecJ [Lentisphaerota bacterium]MBT5605175.1 single-stranded-DNA-specific exonuclease RecJ [Lentisphaerota bacterium]MBT7054373.1 single-stranded-DNA-specific exonuclease RecJ [Lentisphaerota bacterium]MBT7844843.1 single-stranded-DNA-specific exonuclease RecJ [Lentisphaerota bacterium]